MKNTAIFRIENTHIGYYVVETESTNAAIREMIAADTEENELFRYVTLADIMDMITEWCKPLGLKALFEYID